MLLLSTFTLPETEFAPNVSPAVLPVSVTSPATRLAAQPLAGSPTRMGTALFVTTTPRPGVLAGPEIFDPQTLKNTGFETVIPLLISELVTATAPPSTVMDP